MQTVCQKQDNARTTSTVTRKTKSQKKVSELKKKVACHQQSDAGPSSATANRKNWKKSN